MSLNETTVVLARARVWAAITAAGVGQSSAEEELLEEEEDLLEEEELLLEELLDAPLRSGPSHLGLWVGRSTAAAASAGTVGSGCFLPLPLGFSLPAVVAPCISIRRQARSFVGVGRLKQCCVFRPVRL